MPATSLLSAALQALAHPLASRLAGPSLPTATALIPVPALAVGLLVIAALTICLNPRDRLVRLFALILLTCATTVGANPLYVRHDPLGMAIEIAADGLGTLFFVRFCLSFPEHRHRAPLPSNLWARRLYAYGGQVPVLAGLIYIVTIPVGGVALMLGQVIFSLGLLLGVQLGLVVLGRTFLEHQTSDVRGPILVVWLGAAIAFLPLLLLNVLPTLFFLPDIVPFAQTGYGLIALPISVGFASVRWRRVNLLGLIDRISVYGLLALLLLGCYAGLAVLVANLAGLRVSSMFHFYPLALAVLAAGTFPVVRARVQRAVDTVLYRDYYDLGSTLQRFSRSLATVRDMEAVAASLLDDLCATLNLSGAALVMLPGGLDTAVLRLIEPEDLYTRRACSTDAGRQDVVDHLRQLDPAALYASHRLPLALDPWPGCAALVLIGPGGGEEVSAVLVVGRKQGGGPLRAEDRTLLSTVAHQAATALENALLVGGLRTTLAQLRQSTEQLETIRAEQDLLLRELVDADERQRAALARELHDDTLQDLNYTTRHSRLCAGILASLVDAAPAPPPAAHRLRDELEQLAQAAATSERKLRDLCAGLYPAALGSLGLVAALESLADDLAGAGALSIQVVCEPDAEQLAPLLDADAQLHAYRIAQESLRNACRHAHATRAELRLRVVRVARRGTASNTAEQQWLQLVVGDDGVGIALPVDYVALLREGHLGLASMRERAERIDADLVLTRVPEGGTQLTLTIPLPPGAEEPYDAVPVVARLADAGPLPPGIVDGAASSQPRLAQHVDA